MLAAAWVTAGATVGLLIGAAITAWFAYTAWTTQIGAWATQLMDIGLVVQQARRDAEERRRAQAAQVFTWVATNTSANDVSSSDSGVIVHVSNSSQQPVYDVVVTLPTRIESLRLLLPKEQFTFRDDGSTPTGSHCSVQLTFRDAAGLRWRTSSEGGLNELGEPAAVQEESTAT
jgi:hypothetical protein